MNSPLHGIAGIDEAGRGPMIGPLVVCGVVVDTQGMREILSLGLKDSKLLSPKKREALFPEIKRIALKTVLRKISARTIDRLRNRGVSLNTIEMKAFAQTLLELHPREVYLDAADVIADRFGATVKRLAGDGVGKCRIVSEHKADLRYPIVSAASIIAKVERDKEIRRLHSKYGDFGSGYPNDPKTKKFVRDWYLEHRDFPPIVRRTWASVVRIMDDSKQQTLLDF